VQQNASLGPCEVPGVLTPAMHNIMCYIKMMPSRNALPQLLPNMSNE
jgi:hypothetical protein